MKYDAKITAVLLLAFVASQLTGLAFVNGSIKAVETLPSGEKVIEHTETVIERPQTQGVESLLFILSGVAIATVLLLAIIKLRLFAAWKAWFFFAVFISIAVALGVYIDFLAAGILAFALAAAKILARNAIVHNLTEILMCSGIVVLFVPIFDILWIIALLLIISLYDVIAVRKTGHMVKMARFLNETRLFAGFSIPLNEKGKQPVMARKAGERNNMPGRKGQRTAILGGGDIAFPMLFSGVVMEQLILSGFSNLQSFLLTMVVTMAVSLSLLGLLVIAKKGRFYPAMPFLTAGCLAGYAILWLLASQILF